MNIKFLDFTFQNNFIKTDLIKIFDNFIDSNYYVLGKNVDQFEKEYSNLHLVQDTVSVANGLDALILSLEALNIGEGDEVIVPSNTYIATWLAITAVGAKIIPVEPDIRTYNIDPLLIQAKITSKTKAIMVVHLFGLAANMNSIVTVAEENNLFIIEDNAQAHLATFNGKMTGSFGILNATSFYPGKNLGAFGDGGAVTCLDQTLAQKIRVLRNYGSERKYYNSIIGHNSRLDELQAGFLLKKMEYIKFWTEIRKDLAKVYNRELDGIGDIILPFINEGSTHVFHLYVIRTKKRDELHEYLKLAGIESMIHYPIPPHLQTAYRDLGFQKGDFPIAEEISNTCLSLPLYPGLSDSNMQQIISSIKAFFI